MIEHFITDVDGTLTDGKLHYHEDGTISKSFYCKDGYGLSALQFENINIYAVSGNRPNKSVQNRMENLDVELHEYIVDKLSWFKQNFIDKTNCLNVAYCGDDLNDLPLMDFISANGGLIGLPSDSNERLLNHYKKLNRIVILKNKGGEGAVREFCDYILHNYNKGG